MTFINARMLARTLFTGLLFAGVAAQAQQGPQPKLETVDLTAGMHVIKAELAVTPDAVRDWITRGAVIRDKTPRRAGTGRRLQLRAIRIPQAWRIRRADLDHFLAQLAEANGTPTLPSPTAAAVDQLIQPATYPASRRNRRKAGAA